MKRALVAFGVGALIMLVAPPALAKGPDVRVFTRAVITGPGLKEPIVIQGDVSAYGFDGFEAPHNELTDDLLLFTGLQSGADVGWYVLSPDPHALGPGYTITYTFQGSGPEPTVDVPLSGPGATIDLAVTFRQVVYPYAPERPLVYTAPGQFFLNRMIGQWWSAPPALRTFLTSKGLPAVAPPTTAQQLPAGFGSNWAVAFAATGLLTMVVMAALAGRRAQIRRSA